MKETWYFIAAEFKALGLRCVAHGPEFWLVVPLGAGLLILSALALSDIWRGGRK